MYQAYGRQLPFRGTSLVVNSRTQALAEAAYRLSLTFQPEDWSFGGLASEIHTPPIFERVGPAGRITNIMVGKGDDLESRFFDYVFCDSGRVPIDFKQTLAAFSQDIWLPIFEIAPQDVVHKLIDGVIHKNIQFGSNPIFSSRFRLTGPDKESIRQLFTPGILALLESLDPNSNWHIEGCDLSLIFYQPEHLVSPEEYPQFVKETTTMAKEFFGLSGRAGRNTSNG